MLPVQFILLLIIVSLPQAGTGGPAKEQPGFPWLAALAYVASPMIVAAYAWIRTRKSVRELHEPASSASTIMQHAETLYSRARWLTILLAATILYSTSLPQAVLALIARTPIPRGPDGQFPIVPELLFILPIVAGWMAIWTASYFLQSAGRERSMPFQLAQALPVHEMPTLGRYLALQCRHNFFPFVFLVLEVSVMWAVWGVVRLFPTHATAEQIANRANIIGEFLGPVVAIVTLPWLLIPLWSTTPLTGPLRGRLDAIAARYKLRFRNILIWRTEHMVLNAAILGWMPFARYFLMSDSLLESISDRQIEAVFAHEVGHGVHRHVPWYLAIMLAAFGLSLGLTGGSIYLLQALFHVSNDTVGEILFLVHWLAAAGLSVPFIAPRFEHQADWFASRHMAEMLEENRRSAPAGVADFILPPQPTAADVTLDAYRAGHYPHAADLSQVPPLAAAAFPAHGAGTGAPHGSASTAPLHPASAASPLQAGAEIFISALDAVVESSNRDRDHRGWMHPSVSDRFKLLRDMAAYPTLAEQFNRRMRKLRWIMAAFFIVGGVSGVIALFWGAK